MVALSKGPMVLRLTSPEELQGYHLLKGQQICQDHLVFIHPEVRHLKDVLKSHPVVCPLINLYVAILLEDHQMCLNKYPYTVLHMAIFQGVLHLKDDLKGHQTCPVKELLINHLTVFLQEGRPQKYRNAHHPLVHQAVHQQIFRREYLQTSHLILNRDLQKMSITDR